ncbi:TonB-dependent receptor [candidate division KSB1 bacterium]|nr:TonB-dependent receptor [candidate division KSB1 bacterium]
MFLKKTLFTIILIVIQTECLLSGTIHGFLREKDSKEPIIMGNVWIKDTNIGTTTNMKGYYVLSSLPPGKYDICFRYIGFKTEIFTKEIARNDDIKFDVDLEPETIQYQDIVVEAERDKRELDIKPGQIAMQVPQLRSIPSVAEADLFRSLQMLPGVATLSDFSAGLYIRGGSPDQNLILLDHIDVYNPNHMFGFFSTFNTDAIKSVELLKGGYPSSYGGRLSSVLNVVNKEGNRQEFQGVSRLSLLSFSTTLEGPWKHGSWMVSGRRTYLELAEKMADFNLPYYFYDGHANFNWDINKNNQASISFYAGNDVLDLSTGGMSIKLDWGNKTFSTQWTHLFNSKFFSHFTFAGSSFDSDTRVKFDDIEFGISNNVTDIALKGMLTWTPSTNHSMDFGFETKWLDFGLNYRVVDTDYLNSFAGNYSSIFLQDNYRLTPLTILQTGLRTDYYSDGNYSRFDPRISLKQILTEYISVTGSVGRFHQFLNLVQQGGMSFADMWFPVDKTFKPGSADHYILGFTYDNKTTFSINVEGYYKNYINVAEYRTYRGADETIEDQTAVQNFLSGRGKAYGMDVYLRNNIWGFEGWLGYSLAWTKKQVDGYNFGLEYYPTFDRRHTITAIQDYRLSRKWRINLAFKFGSGQPYTEATARYTEMDQSGRTHYETLDGKKNFYRLPAYHRLDIGLFYNTRIFKLPAEIYIQAVNVYNHKNVWFRHYDLDTNPATVEDITMIPFVPTAGISVNF